MYPKFGPGQMWETVAEEVIARGGRIITGADVERLHVDGDRVTHVEIRDATTGQTTLYSGDYVFSTMPVKELIASLDAAVPENVQAGRRRTALSRLHHRRPAGRQAAGQQRQPAGQEADRRQLDLHPGARRAGRPIADFQQLEPGHGGRSEQGLDRDGIFLLRDRRDLEAIRTKR